MSLILDPPDPEPRTNVLEFPACLSHPTELTDKELAQFRACETKRLTSDAVAVWRAKRAGNAPVAPRRGILSSPGDVPTRPGEGFIDWNLYGRVLRHRQLELEYPPVEENWLVALAVERRIRQELYG